MDKKTKQTVVAIIVAILSIIASTLGVVYGVPQSTLDKAISQIVITE